MRVRTLFNRLLAGKGFVVCSVALGLDQVDIRIRARRSVARCSRCGDRVRRIYDRKSRQWRHLALFGVRVVLHGVVRRVRCRQCGVQTEQVPWARTGAIFTRDFEDEVAGTLRRTDKTTVGRLFRISWETVGRIASRVVMEKVDPGRLENLAFIGVDEFSYQRRHKYITIVVDHERGEPVWIAKGKSAATLDAFFDALGPERSAALQVVSMDMSAAFIRTVRGRAPQAQIVFDRFHLLRLVHDALDAVRRREVACLPPEERKPLKNTRFLLLAASRNLRSRQRVRLRDLQHLNTRVFRAYLLKEEFAALLEIPSPTVAEARLFRWLRWAKRSHLHPFRRVAETVWRHLPGVLSYLHLRLTNALSEGINRKIRLISNRSFGLSSVESLTALIKLCCSNVPLPLPRAA